MSTKEPVLIRCPQCHSPMEEGCLPVAGGMHWVRGRGQAKTLTENIPGTHAVMRTNRLEAWRCRKCQLVTFRYGRSIEQKPQQTAEASSPGPAED
jgi:hypothetical protein